ncbi:ABC transporter substrate-binding protein [uncultured Microbacterium sp.]|uniref:ABC transporter substrate-binding protein n=1 Tax=uncultured Microbacterium sp. TaxID=191216 RepID=UPI00262102EC|nr:ABC transporter substrate-binding protein [uncultured Microbacterium sp.]
MNPKTGFSRLALAATAAGALILTGCAAGSASGGSGEQADTVVVGTSFILDSLNPLQTQRGVAVSAAYDTLVRPVAGQPGQFESRLADSWENTSENEWIFTLREGVTFHDGSEFTAEDVVGTFDAVAEGQYISAPIVAGFASYEAIDDYTVKITTINPDPILLTSLAQMYIVPSDAWAELGENGLASQAIGTGAYEITDFAPDTGVKFTRFEDFWGEPALTENIQVRTFADSSTLTSSIEAGEIDVAHALPATAKATLEGSASVEVVNTAGDGTSYLQFNTLTAPFDNAELRRAANLAVDIDGLIAAASLGLADPEPGQLTDANKFGYTDEITAPAFDADEAAKIVAAEGAEGTPVVLTGLAAQKPALEAVSGMLNDVGFSASVKIVETADWLTLFRITDPNEWATSDTSVFARGLSYVSTSDANRAYQYASRLVDDAKWNELQTAQLQEMDADAREALLIEQAHLLYDNDYILWTTQAQGIGAQVPGISGADFEGGNAMDFTKLTKTN